MLPTPKKAMNTRTIALRKDTDVKLVAAIGALMCGCLLLTAGIMSLPTERGGAEGVGAATSRRMLQSKEEAAPVKAPRGTISVQKLNALPQGTLKFEDGYLSFDKDRELFEREYDLVPEAEQAIKFRLRPTNQEGKFLVYLPADRTLLRAVQNQEEEVLWSLSEEAEGTYAVDVLTMCDHVNCVVRSNELTATLLFGQPTESAVAGPSAAELTETDTVIPPPAPVTEPAVETELGATEPIAETDTVVPPAAEPVVVTEPRLGETAPVSERESPAAPHFKETAGDLPVEEPIPAA